MPANQASGSGWPSEGMAVGGPAALLIIGSELLVKSSVGKSLSKPEAANQPNLIPRRFQWNHLCGAQVSEAQKAQRGPPQPKGIEPQRTQRPQRRNVISSSLCVLCGKNLRGNARLLPIQSNREDGGNRERRERRETSRGLPGKLSRGLRSSRLKRIFWPRRGAKFAETPRANNFFAPSRLCPDSESGLKTLPSSIVKSSRTCVILPECRTKAAALLLNSL